MSRFACIDFINHTILLSKEKLIKVKFLPVFLEPVIEGKIDGYKVYITKNKEELTDRFWCRLEDELLKRDVCYAQIKAIKDYPFEEIMLITGEQVKRVLSKNILDYIFKYKLIPVDEKYAKIGIITGAINETVDVIFPLLNRITNLTLFSDVPEVYKEIRNDIYSKARLKPKVFYPNHKLLSQMDILFDLSGQGRYVNWCNPKAIYIDLMNSVRKQKIKINTLPPIIWYDFDIVFESQQVEKDILEAILYEKGLTKRTLRKKISSLEISIIRTYNSHRS